MTALREAGVGLEAICGGVMSCGTCHVLIDPPWFERLAPAAADERDLLEAVNAFDAQRSRLACQIVVDATLDGLELTIAPSG